MPRPVLTNTVQSERQFESDLRVRVLRNGLINFSGAVVPLVIGVLTIPRIIRGLGIEQFGILSFAWAILGYFTFFDLGIGRATTKFVAELVGQDDIVRLPRLVWTSVVVSTFLGLMGTLVVCALTPLLVERVLKIAPSLAPDTRFVFFILATTLPVVLVSNTLRGVLEAHHRFDLVNAVTVPASAAMFLMPAIGVVAGFRLPAIVLLLASSRFGAVFAFAVMCLKTVPGLRQRRRLDMNALRRLMTYGGWVTASNIVGPTLTYLDRFAIGSLLSTAAVGYYTAPYETVTRLWIFPSSIVSALFPAFSATAARGAETEVGDLASSSVKYLLVAVGPIVTVLFVFAPQILEWWLGPEFASRSGLAFRLLAIGVLANSIAYVPFSLLQAVGRADLAPKLYVVELAIYVPLLLSMVRRFGISGAAFAWTVRVALDCCFLSAACWKLHPTLLSSLRRHRAVPALYAIVALVVGAFAAKIALASSVVLQVVAVTLFLMAFATLSWRRLLDGDERHRLIVVARSCDPRR